MAHAAAARRGAPNPNPYPNPKPNPHQVFYRMGFGDREIVALLCGGHVYGRCHPGASVTLTMPLTLYPHP